MAKGRRGRPLKSALGQSPSPVVERPNEEVVPAKLLAPDLESVVPVESVLTPLDEKELKQYDLYEVKEEPEYEVKDMTEEKTEIEEVPEPFVEEPVEEISVETPMQEVFPSEDDYVDESNEEEKPPRTMASLSKAELRWFQRTGQMPK